MQWIGCNKEISLFILNKLMLTPGFLLHIAIVDVAKVLVVLFTVY